MTVIRQQQLDEADLRRRLAESGDVRVKDTRSGCVGVLYRVERRHVVVLMGSNAFHIPYERLALVDDEATGGTSAPDEAADKGR